MTEISVWLLFGFEGPDEVVGPEGMEKFCEDIGVEPENVGFLHSTHNALKEGVLDKVKFCVKLLISGNKALSSCF